MPKFSFRRNSHRVRYPLPGLAAALAVSILGSGCTDRDGQTNASASPDVTPKEMYIDACASCHGVDGSGNGPMADELRVKPVNLRLLKQQNGGKFPTLDVQRSVDGRAMPRAHGLPKMPVWGRRWIREGLSESEVTARAISITSYIASIQE